MDNIPSGVLKFVYFILCIFTLISLGLFGYRWGTMSTYLSSSQEVVSGYGGLTTEAQQDLQNFSKKDYNNIFSVEPSSQQSSQVADYGQPVHYVLRADIPFTIDATVNHQNGVHHLILTKTINVTTYSNVGKDGDHG